MRTLVLGGARSGKSTHAEELANQYPRVDYLATSAVNPDDPEWVERIAKHQARRPAHWATIETADVANVLAPSGPVSSGTDQDDQEATVVLVDCLGVWLTRMMDEVGIWTTEGEEHEAARGELRQKVDELTSALAKTDRDVILVSNEVGLGIVPEHWSGRFFRDELGILNMRVAEVCERVLLCVAGIPMTVKDIQ